MIRAANSKPVIRENKFWVRFEDVSGIGKKSALADFTIKPKKPCQRNMIAQIFMPIQINVWGMGKRKYPAHNIGRTAIIKKTTATKYDFLKKLKSANTISIKLKGAARISIQSNII